MKPGITGLAQVSGRNAISWDKKLRLNLEYINNWSLSLDLKVFYLKLLKVLAQAGLLEDLNILRTAARHNKVIAGIRMSVLQGGTMRRDDQIWLA